MNPNANEVAEKLMEKYHLNDFSYDSYCDIINNETMGIVSDPHTFSLMRRIWLSHILDVLHELELKNLIPYDLKDSVQSAITFCQRGLATPPCLDKVILKGILSIKIEPEEYPVCSVFMRMLGIPEEEVVLWIGEDPDE